MLAPRQIPYEFRQWNRHQGAPAGFDRQLLPVLRRRDVKARFPQIAGPFGIQENNVTRRYEYPWAWHAVPIIPDTTIVDLGGSLCGLQFALSREGARVLNVDPGSDAAGLGWQVDQPSIARLNRAFGTEVTLVNTTLDDAGLASDSIDTLYSISTIEHIPSPHLPGLMREIARVLKPGGHCVLTVDLFLNLAPFTNRESNEYGTNVSPRSLVEASGLDLVQGERRELLGYPEFDAATILASLERYLVGSYPALAECFVLQKPR